jgi:hypothetical protein
MQKQETQQISERAAHALQSSQQYNAQVLRARIALALWAKGQR